MKPTWTGFILGLLSFAIFCGIVITEKLARPDLSDRAFIFEFPGLYSGFVYSYCVVMFDAVKLMRSLHSS